MNARAIRLEQGFTLLELMVVVTIIGIMGLALGLGVSRSDDTFANERDRLRAVLELALQTAIIESSEYGFSLTEDGYHFLALKNDEWIVFKIESGPLQAHEIPERIRLSLESDLTLAETQDTLVPEVLLLSSGEMTAFELQLSDSESGDFSVLQGYTNGKLLIQEP